MRPRKQEIQQLDREPAIYIRVSTDKQVKSGLGLDDQKAKTLAEAQRLGLTIKPEYIFIDEGLSGKKAENKRPMYGRLMEQVKAGLISHVIVNDLSRLGRSVHLISNAIVELDRYDTAFVSVKESFNTSHAMGKAMLNMVATFAQLESDLASERTEDALDMRGDKYGYKAGQVAFGYTRIPNSDNSKSDEVIRILDSEASIVKLIFKLRDTDKLSMGKIADTLNSSGIKSAKGSKWYASSVKVILDNEPIYTGKVAHYPAII